MLHLHAEGQRMSLREGEGEAEPFSGSQLSQGVLLVLPCSKPRGLSNRIEEEKGCKDERNVGVVEAPWG